MSTPRVDGAEERKTFDLCACGKRKEVADYVCHECFRAPHRVRPSRESKSQNASRVTVIASRKSAASSSVDHITPDIQPPQEY